jgi:hypothetical protein
MEHWLEPIAKALLVPDGLRAWMLLSPLSDARDRSRHSVQLCSTIILDTSIAARHPEVPLSYFGSALI